MKRKGILFFLCFFLWGFSQNNIPSGEKLVYRIHYGFINAGYATLVTSQENYKGIPHLHVKGFGKTNGFVSTFFKVDDFYESLIDLNTGLPSFYIRNVREGGYTQHLETLFNHQNNTLELIDKEKKPYKSTTLKSVKGVQDMLSAFYYLRNLPASSLYVGSVHRIDIWIDDNLFPFQLKVVGIENKKTKFGSVECLKIIPSVMNGRVFKNKEGVTMWVTNDINHIPVEVKADILVGSIKASLDSYKNVKSNINFK